MMVGDFIALMMSLETLALRDKIRAVAAKKARQLETPGKPKSYKRKKIQL